MGATGWSYFVPFQDDVQKALDELREKVFAEGRYEHPGSFDADQHEQRLAFLNSVYEKLPPGERRDHALQFVDAAREAGNQLRKRKKPRPAKNIKQLLRQCGESGTHSIIDIDRVSLTPAFGAVSPLSPQQLLDFFDTEQPTHEMLEAWSKRVDSMETAPLYERWQGICVIVYENLKPAEIYFEGCSGD